MIVEIGPDWHENAARRSAPTLPRSIPPGQYLAAVASNLARHGLSASLTHIGRTPVLTVDDPAGGPDATSISVNPNPGDPSLPLECTCLWTPPPGAGPDALASTIRTVLDAVRVPRFRET
jgi:hypothetical protein